MLKFSSFVYHYHQPPDAYNAKLLFNHFVRRGRELLEKVRNGGRHSATVPDVPALPRVTPTVVCTTARSAVYWQKSAAAWKNLVSGYLARSQNGGFASKFAKNCRPQWPFGSWHGTNSYRGLARKIAMFGFVGVAVSGNGRAQHLDLSNHGNDDIYSAIRDMFTVEPKHSHSEQPVSIDSLDDLRLGEVITSDGCGAFFTATISRHHPETIVEMAEMKGVQEMMNNQHQQLTDLVHIAHAQNTQLREIVSFHAAAVDDAVVSPLDNSLLTTSVDWSCDVDEVLNYIEKCIEDQCRQIMDVSVTVCCQNSELRAACNQLHSSANVSETITEETTCDGDVTDSDDDDDEGFVVISCEDESDLSWCDIADQNDDRFMTLINFVNTHNTLAVTGQRDTELTQLSNDKANSETSAKNSVVNSEDVTTSVMVRVQVLTADDGLTPSTVSLTGDHHLMHVNLVRWSHPTEPPDKLWRRRSDLPSHFNVAETYGGFVTDVDGLLALGRHCDVLHGLPQTLNVQRDFAVCTVLKQMKMTLAEFLSSHSVDIRCCQLLVLQLIEAVLHLRHYNVSCSNLKSSSIFVELLNDEPHLMVADFGRVSPDDVNGHYGQRFSSSRCTESDMSAVVDIAAEILSACSDRSRYDTPVNEQSSDTTCLPTYVTGRLMGRLLQTEPQLSAGTVANALHIMLWAPQHWITALQSDTTLPDSLTLSWWLVHLAAVTHCCQHHTIMSHNATCDTSVSRPSTVGNSLRRIFLSRVSLCDITDALALIQASC